MPPVILWALGAVGGAFVVKWLVKEARRVNADLDAVKAATSQDSPRDRRSLERDPATGVYRPK